MCVWKRTVYSCSLKVYYRITPCDAVKENPGYDCRMPDTIKAKEPAEKFPCKKCADLRRQDGNNMAKAHKDKAEEFRESHEEMTDQWFTGLDEPPQPSQDGQ